MPPKRILFGVKPEWEAGLHASTDPEEFRIVMAELPKAADAGFDAVVPLSLTELDWCETQGAHLPALPTPRPLRRLCHDKLALNRRLIALGFGDHIPLMRDRLPADPARHPVIVKARRAAWGKETWLVHQPEVPEQVQASLLQDSHFIQDYLPGRFEYACHVLMHRGVPQHCQTIEYDMGKLPGVKGVGLRPRAHRWLAETPGQGALFAMLAAIGYTDGTCCIDYRMVEGRPMLFEINPRVGGSLTWNVAAYLRRYLACVASGASGGSK